MTAAEDENAPTPWADEELLATHEAAHCLMFWKLGLGIRKVTLERVGKAWAHTTPARVYDLTAAPDRGSRRGMIERSAMYLHAGSVAERLLRPYAPEITAAGIDHLEIHAQMALIEESGSVQYAWCDYLWQRTYEYLAWPGRWKPLVALAGLLRKHRTIDGRSVELYLARATEFVKHAPGGIPDFKLVGEVTYATSPLHQGWHNAVASTSVPPKSTDLPAGIEAVEAALDLRPIETVLGPHSPRARKILKLADIRTARDLADWSPRALGRIRGAGKTTIQEIVEAAARVGIRLRPDHGPYPWEIDRRRWR